MSFSDRTPHYVRINNMRTRWKNGEISTLDYHNYIEKVKRSISQERGFTFF